MSYNDTMQTLQAAMTVALENSNFRSLAMLATTAARMEEARVRLLAAERAAAEALEGKRLEAE